jgi:hypothetical protein
MRDGHVIFSPAERDFASDFFKLKVLKKRYDFYAACGPIFGIKSKPSPTPKVWVPIIPNLGPLGRFGGRSSAYRLSEKNMTVW